MDFFKSEKKYNNILKNYGRKDGFLAIAIYILVIFTYYIMGTLYIKLNLYLGYGVNFSLTMLCILCVVISKQSIETIGFGKRNLFKSLILGCTLSVVLLIIYLIYGILGGYQFNTISILILKFINYFFVIAVPEEIIFRGFIQTRIYGLIRNKIFAVLLVAFMFMTIHIPFHMVVAKMGLLMFIESNYVTLLFTFLWHIVFNFLYSKYNSIVAPTVFHTILDWVNVIFK